MYFKTVLPKDDATRLDEHLSAIRDLERAIAGLPRRVSSCRSAGIRRRHEGLAAHREAAERSAGAGAGDTADARCLLHADQVPGTVAIPVARSTAARHHDYTHADGKAPGADGADGQRVLRDICRWHVEEFAYLLAKLKSIPEGDGTVLDHTCLVYVHEHAEANPHKNSGLAMIVAGHAGRLATGMHSKVTGTVGDLYVTVADDVLNAGIGKFPTATRKISEILA